MGFDVRKRWNVYFARSKEIIESRVNAVRRGSENGTGNEWRRRNKD